jgi:hypothetical protein
MDITRRYRCDHGHEWSVVAPDDEEERAEDVSCADGHEAVTRIDEAPADEVQIVIRPAARIVDPARQQVVDAGKYHVVLLDRTGAVLRRGTSKLTWEEAVQRAHLFRGKTAAAAAEWWERGSC